MSGVTAPPTDTPMSDVRSRDHFFQRALDALAVGVLVDSRFCYAKLKSCEVDTDTVLTPSDLLKGQGLHRMYHLKELKTDLFLIIIARK